MSEHRAGEGWTRLSPLKLLVDPIKALKEMIVPVVMSL